MGPRARPLPIVRQVPRRRSYSLHLIRRLKIARSARPPIGSGVRERQRAPTNWRKLPASLYADNRVCHSCCRAVGYGSIHGIGRRWYLDRSRDPPYCGEDLLLSPHQTCGCCGLWRVFRVSGRPRKYLRVPDRRAVGGVSLSQFFGQEDEERINEGPGVGWHAHRANGYEERDVREKIGGVWAVVDSCGCGAGRAAVAEAPQNLHRAPE